MDLNFEIQQAGFSSRRLFAFIDYMTFPPSLQTKFHEPLKNIPPVHLHPVVVKHKQKGSIHIQIDFLLL